MIRSSSRLLQEYSHEREILLSQIDMHLQNDPAVLAAWLAGSLGRGEGDELSDIDVWVVVKQEHTLQLVEERRDSASKIADPILFVEAPQNAPAGGGYLAACYDAPAAPHLVDWYWQPETRALPSVPLKLLFDRSESTSLSAPAHFTGQAASHDLPNPELHSINFF